MTSRILLAIALVSAPALPAQMAGSSSDGAVTRLTQDLIALTADTMDGRGVGTRGIDLAAQYIASRFKEVGLGPALHGSYFHEFIVRGDAPAVAHTNLGGTAARNVVGIVRGSEWPGSFVVIGAHYDHLGFGGMGSLDPDSTGVVHNGADDNASGTTALIEAAGIIATRQPKRSVVVIAFSGEELGLLGSTSFVKDAPIPIDSIYAMINMDMVGRLRGSRLALFGANSAMELPGILDEVNKAFGLKLAASGDGYGRSDHSSFYVAGRPVVHFFTGTHEDYHRTTDDWEKLNVAGIDTIARFAADLTMALAARPEPLTYVAAPPPAPATGGGYGAYLGSIPDMTESPGGVRLTGVRAGSPAAEAGLTGGDILTRIGDFEIGDLYDMTDALRSYKPGDTVWVVAKRGDREIRVRVTFGRRGG